MLKINLYKNKNQDSDNYGKIYGRCENAEPIDISGLAKHMAEHNSPYSKGLIKGILDDMVVCLKELMLMGQPVKIADLAIFKASVVSTPATDVETFDLAKNIKSVKLLALATGEVSRKQLTRDALLGYTSMALRIKNGEAVLSGKKKEYLLPGSATSNSEPTVNP